MINYTNFKFEYTLCFKPYS